MEKRKQIAKNKGKKYFQFFSSRFQIQTANLFRKRSRLFVLLRRSVMGGYLIRVLTKVSQIECCVALQKLASVWSSCSLRISNTSTFTNLERGVRGFVTSLVHCAKFEKANKQRPTDKQIKEETTQSVFLGRMNSKFLIIISHMAYFTKFTYHLRKEKSIEMSKK